MTDERTRDDTVHDRDGVARRGRRERKQRRRMQVHGRSIEAIMNAIRKRAKRPPRGHAPD